MWWLWCLWGGGVVCVLVLLVFWFGVFCCFVFCGCFFVLFWGVFLGGCCLCVGVFGVGGGGVWVGVGGVVAVVVVGEGAELFAGGFDALGVFGRETGGLGVRVVGGHLVA
ncbi:hypothetical protein, partial [Klebsiella pneumoniae]|uniref:hypothetical protein n=1 Tax=Klebsiella pneumoniae TaxID=573 RepID=UPI001C3E837C